MTEVVETNRSLAMFSLTPPVPKSNVSLRDVMDEQYASKLQEKEQSSRYDNDVNFPESEDEDLLLALKLSEEESKKATGKEPSSNETPESVAPVDEDFLYALKLQQELDSDEFVHQMLEKERSSVRQPNHPKVSSAFDFRPYGDPALYEDYSDSEEEDVEEPETYIDPIKQYHQVVKTEGRVPAKILTKHDPLLASIKNVSHLENAVDSGSMGDLRISTPVYNALLVDAKKQETRGNRVRGNRLDITTSEQVMDQRTRVNLLKLINGDALKDVNGIISTGKEANVYYGLAGGNIMWRESKEKHEEARAAKREKKKKKMKEAQERKKDFKESVEEEEEDLSDDQEEELSEETDSNKELQRKSLKQREVPTVEEGAELAVKIYKTTLKEFKSRADYIEGEFRFRRQPIQNSRKLIKLWAEKEMRNLKRLQAADIPSPTPLLLKENILVMTFLGKKGIPFPTLKEASLSPEKLRECYNQTIRLMRRMYHDCRLIHADFSEYNILYSKGKVWFIDVSQSVEHDHPRALEFLKNDCKVIIDFFRKSGLPNCMSIRDLFDFVTDRNLSPDKVDSYLASLDKEISLRENISNEDQVTEAVFQHSFTPRTLAQVKSPVSEIFDQEPAFHHAVTGLTQHD